VAPLLGQSRFEKEILMEAYLDNNATTKPLVEVREAMLETLGPDFGNPSSSHGVGESARHLVEQARGRVAELLACRETEVIFTACATESINTALQGVLAAANRQHPRRLIISAVEHEAVIELARHLERHRGVALEVVGVDHEGKLDLQALQEALKKPASLLSLMLANNETGVLFPVREAADLAHERGVPVHVDAVQAVGKMPLFVDDLGADLLSLSAHKFHGPKGVGVLYVRRGTALLPLMVGAGQEGGRRGGTENVPGIVGLGVAAEHMRQGIPERRDHLLALTRRLENTLLALPGSALNGAPKGRLPGTCNISFEGIEGHLIVLTAAREGVMISAGAACGASRFGGSHVLEAMGVPYPLLHGSVRFSCAETTTLEEVELALGVVKRAVAYLRGMAGSSKDSSGSRALD